MRRFCSVMDRNQTTTTQTQHNIFTPEHGQEDVWRATEPLVQSAIDGWNVTVFAYGQTGSGKTYVKTLLQFG